MTTDTLPHYEVHDGTGPYMLLVHGFLSSRAQWRPNLARLSEFVRPVLVELLAHGRSPAPAEDAPYRVQSYTAAFDDIRRRIGVGRWVVCGQSFGAGLAIHSALAHRDNTMAVVVTNSLSAFTPPGDKEREQIQAERIRTVSEQGRPALEALRIHPRHAKRLPEDAKAELVADAAGISLDGVVRSWRVTSPELHLVHRLREVGVPSLLVNGTWEKRFQPLRAAAVEAAPAMEIVDLPGGHSINMEAADGFTDAVHAFLTRHGILS